MTATQPPKQQLDLVSAHGRAGTGLWKAFTSSLFRPIDPASLAVFRMLFGAIMVWEVCRFFAYGWIEAHYIEPGFLFGYPGFAWIRPWPGSGMYWHFAGLGVLAALIAIGLFYRVAMVLFFLGFTYVFLLDQARYLNHFYLVALVSFLMTLVPASRIWSVDAWLSQRQKPRIIPAWTVFILTAQVEIMYLYAGLMKIDRDWLELEPLGVWLAESAELPVIGPLLLNESVVALAAYGSIALHLIGAPLLLFKATRLYVFLAYCVFHGLNALFWNIGIFPWFTMAATLLFFSPDWPRRVFGWIGRRVWGVSEATRNRATGLIPTSAPTRGAVTSFVIAWIVLQVAVPLRFLAYPGFVSWHEQGHQFSWQMMLRDKTGVAVFVVRDPATGRTWQVEPGEFLTQRQARKMAGRPEMIRLFAHHLKEVWAQDRGISNVEVRALTAVSLNGRPSQPLVDPTRNLAAVPYSLGAAGWIASFQSRLPPKEQRWRDDMDHQLGVLMAEHGIIDAPVRSVATE